ncbi:amino acid adenylation domain-containing protein [Cellulomonas sp.]|uniref:amino acid adenylation domain-containing protein n=1 Tax=Cellulomonas sp. TaxID=40001 RepID=UPI001B287C27|nr:amino acid adenylation domain-containing protein [Cellulomonas sp.]MBO9553562.1 amino acid adenylation domain-containing protein [Cellulomonas sp.]
MGLPTGLSREREALLRRRLTTEGLDVRSDAIPVRTDGRRVFPLSFAQARLWFLDRLHPGNVFYTIDVALRLDFSVDPVLLQRCVDEVVARHEALRTTFETRQDEPVQVVHAALPVRVALVDVGDAPDPQAAAVGVATAQARTPFDLRTGPLMRVTLVRLAPARWVLAVAVHHIVADGWSMRVLFAEIAALYSAHARRQEPALVDLTVQYPDYAVWQRDRLGTHLDGQLDYWTQQLAALPVLDLPTDRPRPPVQTFTGATTTFTLPAPAVAALRSLTTAAGATPFMGLLTVFGALLGRYAGTDDVVIGAPIAGRTRVELEPLIGFFVNTLVLRLDLSGDPTFSEALARTRRTALDAYAHQDVPFEKLVETLKPPRDLSRNPLASVAFHLFSDPHQQHAAPAGGPTPDTLQVERGTAVFDLVVTTWDDDGTISGRIEFNTDLFDAATVDRLIAHLSTLLTEATTHPDRPLSRLDLRTAAERVQLRAWNDTATALPTTPVEALLSAHAATTPDATALVTDGETWTYRRLEERTNRLAHHLRGLGVGPGTLVGVCAERSPHLPAAVLAILKAGGAYLPLDPTYPPDRLRDILDDARPALVLADAPAVPPTDVPTLDLATIDLDTHPDTPPEQTATDDDLAYVIYTSGSTGRPKGVEIPRRGLTNRIAWMQDAYRLTPADRVLHKTSIGFDVSVWELVWPTAAGAAMVLAAPGRGADPAYLVDLVRRTGVTTVHFVPSVLQRFLEHRDVASARSLRRVVCSGEALGAGLAQRLLATLDVELDNLYGPTEASIDVTAWRVTRQDTHVVPLGRPIANVRCHVLDEHLEETPVGVPGQLALAGVCLARGYVGRPDLTAERFVEHPLGGAPDGRVYLTGDRARWTAAGVLEYLGRADEQVKVRGVRIELGEVVAAIDDLGVAEACAVDARPGADGQTTLVAYLVLRSGDELPSASDLRSRLAVRLPDAFLPTAVVGVPSLPLTRSGKLDRRALPDPDGAARPSSAGPSTPTEERVLGIWQDVLHRPVIGVDDNFFDLGGHSLLATQVVARLQYDLGVDLPLVQLFESPTVAALARRVDALRDAGGGDARITRRSDPDAAADLLDRIDTLTDDEVEDALRELSRGEPT